MLNGNKHGSNNNHSLKGPVNPRGSLVDHKFKINREKAQWAPAPHSTQYVTVPDTDVLMKTNPPVETVDSSRQVFKHLIKF